MRFLAFFLLIALISCHPSKEQEADKPDYYSHITDNKVREVLKKAIGHAGGIAAWYQLKKIRYTKHSKLYHSDSTIEIEHIKRHEYTMQPEFGGTISWMDDQNDHLVRFIRDNAEKFVNDSLVGQYPIEAVMSALYTLGMPFKLLDPGVVLQHKGQRKLPSGEIATVIQATYNPKAYSDHSTQDEWHYFFGPESGRFLGAIVHHPPTYAYIQNVEYDHTTPLVFNKYRKSYRTDSLGNIKFLRAEFWYSDYEVE